MLTEAHKKWNKGDGDNTHILDYPLTENSIVLELGGYEGLWTENIVRRYNCRVVAVEPIPSFYNRMVSRLTTNIPNYEEKISVENIAISTEPKVIKLYASGDASTAYSSFGVEYDVQCITLEALLEKYNIGRVDLIQVNIEGEEYPLFEKWIQSDILKRFRFVQVQFHSFIENCTERRNLIQQGLTSLGFKLRYEYEFIWECWENKNYDK
jgi:FkbM family methyltransferase